MAKKRLDVIITEEGLAASREKAKIMLMSGIVYVNGQKEDKPGTMLDPDPAKTKIEVRGETLPYVSRGGLKLEKALKVFPIDLKGRVCMDIGASTGGFTDCMLQNGAAHVYSIDVGYGQLDWKLRNDPRVTCMEKMNFRYMKPEDLPEISLSVPAHAHSDALEVQASANPGSEEQKGETKKRVLPTFASCDVSFISLSKILPAAAEILPVGAQMVCLIKPQFEAGRDKVGHKGVVRDPKVHREVIAQAIGYAEADGFRLLGLDFSPIRGPEGNIEYLMYLERTDDPTAAGIPVDENRIAALVDASHEAFAKAEKT